MLFANSALALHECCKIANDDSQKVEQMDCHKKVDENNAEKQISQCKCGSNVTTCYIGEVEMSESSLIYSTDNINRANDMTSTDISQIDHPPI